MKMAFEMGSEIGWNTENLIIHIFLDNYNSKEKILWFFYLVGIYVVWAEGKTRLLLNVKVDRVSDT